MTIKPQVKLKRSPTSNPFCVPAALALLLNIHVDEAVKLLKEDIGDQPITGVFYPLILKNIQLRGFTYREKRWNGLGTYLFVFRGHVGVLIDNVYYDNQIPGGTEVLPNRRIEKCFRIERPI